LVQVLVVLAILVLSRKLVESKKEGPKHHLDVVSGILSALGFVIIIVGLQTTATYGWFVATQNLVINNTVLLPQGGISPFLVFLAIGIFFNIMFYLSIRHRERVGKEPLLQTHILHNKTSNLGLVTQIVQWLILQGTFFVISVFLQTVRGYTAIETGLILTSATIGVLFTSSIAGRLAKKRSQRLNIRSGFVLTIIGIVLLLVLSGATQNIFYFLPGLFLIGAGVGIMLTSSVNVVQSAFPEKDQGEISGLSRSISNLGSSLGVSIVGSVLVSNAVVSGTGPYVLALIVMISIAIVGLVAAILIPNKPPKNVEKAAINKKLDFKNSQQPS
jgi:Na+/melibiose symporter-like transporter